MATTHVPAPNLLNPEVTTEDVLREAHTEHLVSQADLDKASDPEDAAYHQGRVDAFEEVKNLLTHEPTETPEVKGIRLVADYQMMGDLAGEQWAHAVFGEAVRTGAITAYQFTGSHAGAYGLQFVTFTVDLPFSEKFPPTVDAVTAAADGQALLNEIVGDSDVEVRWACGAAW